VGIGANSISGNSPFIVGVSGHRDLHPADRARLREAVRSFVREIRAHLPDTELHVMVGMAEGADLLVAQTVLELGVRVEAVLPMPLVQYANDFDPDTLQLLKGLLSRPEVSCTELVPPPPAVAGNAAASRDAMYANLTETLIRRSSLLLALWDGKPSALPGGTADTVLRFLGVRTDADQATDNIAMVDIAEDLDTAERLVYWAPAVRGAGDGAAETRSPGFLRGLGDNTLQMQQAMPAPLVHQLAALNHYNREYQQLQADGSLGVPDSLFAALPADVPLAAGLRLEDIDAQYAKADALAVYYQQRSDLLFQLFGVMTFTMGLAYLVYEKLTESRLVLIAYLGVMFTSLGLYYVLHGRHWFAKHLTYRALAETMRVKFYLRLASVDHRVDASEVLALSGIDRFRGFSWIGYVLAGVEVPDLHAANDAELEERRLRCVEQQWIESQHHYFTRKVASLEQSSNRILQLRNTLLGVILVVIIALFLFGDALHRQQLGYGVSLQNLLTFCMGFLAVLLGAWELHQNKMATRELLWQYRNQQRHFARARLDLARFTTQSRRNDVLVGLGKDSLMESYLWTIHRYHREHEPPTGH
jgi:hypothetical protein